MNIDSLVLMTGLAVGLCAFVAFLARSHYKKQADALTGASTKIAHARPGHVKLEGRVSANESLESPVSNKKCLYMQVVFKDLDAPVDVEFVRGPRMGQQSIRATGGQKRVAIVRKANQIYLEDDSGRIEVDFDDADIELLVDKSFQTGSLSSNDPQVETLMRRFGARSGASGIKGRCQLTEIILEAGDKIIVTGNLTMDGTGQMRVSGTDDDPVFITDKSSEVVAKSSKQKALMMTITFLVLSLLAASLIGLGFVTGSKQPDRVIKKPVPVEKTKGW
ncbi:MAG: hypothetical protein JRJ87_21815 [Deltaproteobacteria bacterium]|nr:hypothetical protein [Deltaproteobacteria bacterium]